MAIEQFLMGRRADLGAAVNRRERTPGLTALPPSQTSSGKPFLCHDCLCHVITAARERKVEHFHTR